MSDPLIERAVEAAAQSLAGSEVAWKRANRTGRNRLLVETRAAVVAFLREIAETSVAILDIREFADLVERGGKGE